MGDNRFFKIEALHTSTLELLWEIVKTWDRRDTDIFKNMFKSEFKDVFTLLQQNRQKLKENEEYTAGFDDLGDTIDVPTIV
jgi:hypothetical protein